MKVRKGFVSNSSSSSFICDISGEEVQGMDLSLEAACMYCCEEGHYFLEEFLVGELTEDEDENGEDIRYAVPKENCPICSFKYLMEDSMVLYVGKFYNITANEVFDYMKSTNKRLRKLRNKYWFEYLEKERNVSKLQLEEEIKLKFKNIDEFEESLRK